MALISLESYSTTDELRPAAGGCAWSDLIDHHYRGYHLSFDHWGHEDLMSGTIKVGVAGWSYKDWQGIVYPESLNAKSRV